MHRPADPLTITSAARALGRSPSTIRRWVQRGAPCESLGRGARGCGSLVNLADLERWYVAQRLGPAVPRRDETDALDRLAVLLLDFFKRESGLDGPAHHLLGIPDQDAAGYLALLHRYLSIRLLGRELTAAEYPEPVKTLLDIARTRARD